MVGGRKPIHKMHVGVELNKALAELGCAVPTTVSCNEIDIPFVIDGRRLARLPDTCFFSSGRSIEEANLLE